jgi:hypothetical protein
MQITAGLTLAWGILAWASQDHATTTQHYKEALDLAATHLLFTVLLQGLPSSLLKAFMHKGTFRRHLICTRSL